MTGISLFFRSKRRDEASEVEFGKPMRVKTCAACGSLRLSTGRSTSGSQKAPAFDSFRLQPGSRRVGRTRCPASGFGRALASKKRSCGDFKSGRARIEVTSLFRRRRAPPPGHRVQGWQAASSRGAGRFDMFAQRYWSIRLPCTKGFIQRCGQFQRGAGRRRASLCRRVGPEQIRDAGKRCEIQFG
jgi:hypothetical protein